MQVRIRGREGQELDREHIQAIQAAISLALYKPDDFKEEPVVQKQDDGSLLLILEGVGANTRQRIIDSIGSFLGSDLEFSEFTPIQLKLKEGTETLISNPFLEKLKRGELTVEQWHTFAKQRYFSAQTFEDLLEAGIAAAQNGGHHFIAEELMSNLLDEKGLNAQGEALKLGSHESWRQDFYLALSIDQRALENIQPLPGSQNYLDVVEELIRTGDVFMIVGAILMKEYSIPYEFESLKAGRDLTFPERFVFAPEDSLEQRQAKSRARRYINHHINHDRHSHYPKLERELFRFLDQPDALAKIIDGIDLMGRSTLEFYKSLEQI